MRLRVFILIILFTPGIAMASLIPAYPKDEHKYFAPSPVFLAKKWDELSDKEKKKIRDAKEKYRKLPKEDREKLREKWEKTPKKEREKYKLEKKYR